MATCAFFGHRTCNYMPYKARIRSVLIDLIENHDVTQFYNGCRGDFDRLCADVVYELKEHYPQIKQVRVLSYHPNETFGMSKHFDESVYLLEKRVPPRYAISQTNRCLVALVDYIVSGVISSYGGAYTARNYAKRLNKPIIEIVREGD
ncbi:MAG: hypothetical protein J1G38_00735 [Clostridiales bacterium]|nr:hypothetical protein [Clostridiales bacterium]